ncbi:hypothetical protein B0H19DRAFT_915536, partial [Mycena capillaripes]
LIILDGVDECEDHDVQQRILKLFIGAIQHHHLSIHILIVSCPEPHLQEILETKEMSPIYCPLALSADQSVYDDIRTYLRGEFFKICSDCMSRGINLGAIWPGQDALDHLVKKSCGIFIYAATVICFVGDEYRHPADWLASLL